MDFLLAKFKKVREIVANWTTACNAHNVIYKFWHWSIAGLTVVYTLRELDQHLEHQWVKEQAEPCHYSDQMQLEAFPSMPFFVWGAEHGGFQIKFSNRIHNQGSYLICNIERNPFDTGNWKIRRRHGWQKESFVLSAKLQTYQNAPVEDADIVSMLISYWHKKRK